LLAPPPELPWGFTAAHAETTNNPAIKPNEEKPKYRMGGGSDNNRNAGLGITPPLGFGYQSATHPTNRASVTEGVFFIAGTT
jgi:hypothetical protein